MARKNKNGSAVELTFWLLLSVAGGVLFSFGLLNYFESIGWSPLVAVISGAFLTLFAILMGKYKTETSVALKKK